MANIKDVAREAGVSIATVSRVLNKTGTVATATKQKVNKAIEKTGFIISASAVSMKKQESRLIPFYICDDIKAEDFKKVIEIMIDYLEVYGFSLVVFNTSTNFINKHSIQYALTLKPKFIVLAATNKKILKYKKEFEKNAIKVIALKESILKDDDAIVKAISIIKK